MRALLLKAWLRPLVVGLSLFLGISGGSWATMHWLWRSIKLRIETLATLNLQIEEARWTLAEMEEMTWGVTLREIEGKRFVVLPAGTVRRRAAECVFTNSPPALQGSLPYHQSLAGRLFAASRKQATVMPVSRCPVLPSGQCRLGTECGLEVFSNPDMSMNGPLGGAEGGCEGEG